LCKQFADASALFLNTLRTAKDEVTSIQGELEALVSILSDRIANVEQKEGAALPEIKALQEKVDAAGITNNPYTIHSFKDVIVKWQQYQSFLQRKKQQIEQEIEHRNLHGVTPAQMEEINKQFAEYDLNHNQKLDANEFKACLFSLGHDTDMVSLRRIMMKYGGSETAINYEGFRAFMIAQLGDTDTKEEILGGFRCMNHGKPCAQLRNLEMYMSEQDMEYFKAHAPLHPSGDGYDYHAFVDSLFER